MRKTLIVALMTCALTVAFVSPAVAVTRVSGVVKNISTHKVIKGAVVTISKRSKKTNKRGYYVIGPKSSGRLLVKISAKGYLSTYQIVNAKKNKRTRLNWFLTRSYPKTKVPAHSTTVLAWNDLGMHCDQNSYKYFMVLPPYNTLRAQVFSGGESRRNYTVSYAFAKKTDSTLHTDFWQYASNFGYNLANNVGLAGKGLTGTMQRDSRGIGYVAEGIPVTPYDDDGTWDPYGAATLTVKNTHGQVVARTNVVVPVSTEMNCSNCHGANYAEDLLGKHDTHNGTSLLADANNGHPHACSECHSDNAIKAPGKPGVESLSLAMHKRHDGKVANTTTGCYNCHPGPKTQCLRGIMARAGKGCVDCHGTIGTVWRSAATGRQPWLNEPTCGSCHGSKYAANPGTLYRNSVIKKTHEDMGGKIYCEACHNGTHAEYTTLNGADSVVTRTYQGNGYWIYNCAVCHKSGGEEEVRFKGQAMHR
jgi:Carboxypeptidase regulatory-like domain/Cytochrome c3